jgi:hypothetical protein
MLYCHGAKIIESETGDNLFHYLFVFRTGTGNFKIKTAKESFKASKAYVILSTLC